jgi:DNA polymerase-3 subunit gamma/tau
VWVVTGIVDAVVTALYRRYRPETFAELIGQSQVTDPLRTALRADRVNHAYLFSGPRGCGKTTSARILARCLNCAEGPTDTPCGVCASCVELSRDGSGSLDVVEIDAASHNGVDDARDLRERAVFAPARDRYKIFILDEAHMVTPQGFNALLKIVEEPPEHVKFIFATTEPEKVIGTIRSRTHHYPFRLVPPAQMLEYTQTLCDAEGITVAPGVLPLVVRAGGGSVRDTLSLLDQLMAGSEATKIEYERAVALLGYTHGALLDEVVDAIGGRDAAAAFSAVDRVIQTGQDPRRFVEDLLERLRDLIIVAATSDGAAAVLRGIPQDELDRMALQAHKFGTAELSRAADVVNAALTEMTGATSPRLHLELMIARVLVPASDETNRGALARVERLERRIGVDGPAAAEPSSVALPSAPPTPRAEPIPRLAAIPRVEAIPPVEPVETSPTVSSPKTSATAEPATPEPATAEPATPEPATPEPATVEPAPVSLQQIRDSWPQILEAVQKAKRAAWMVVYTAKPLELRDNNVLVLSFPSQNDVDGLKQPSAPGEGVGDHLKQAMFDLLGIRPGLLARVEPTMATTPATPPVAPPAAPLAASAAPAPTAPDDEVPDPIEPDLEPDIEGPMATDAAGWAVVQIPTSNSEPDDEPTAARPPVQRARAASSAAAGIPAKTTQPKTDPAPATPATPAAPQRYGESVVREILGASFIEEQPVAPRVTPRIE